MMLSSSDDVSQDRSQRSAHEPPIVRFQSVRKSYDGRTLVVRDLNLDVARGEFLTLLGPSGSGKTTTLMMLAGFETPTSGSIYLDGTEISRMPPFKRGIGMVFQNYALFPHMTVAENVAFPLTVRKLDQSEVEARTRRALAMVRLEGFGDRRPLKLSGGQQQRVALARAMVFEPKIVLLDEPLGALDKQLRERMQFELKQMHQEFGVTMIYVTHDQSEALTMSDRIAVFDDGVIQQLAPPEQLYEEPANLFVAQFIGESNRLEAQVLSCQGEYCLVRLRAGAESLAWNVDLAVPGDQVQLSIRPERIQVSRERHDGPGGLAVTISDLVYMGDTLRLVTTTNEKAEVVVKLSPDIAHDTGQREDRVWLNWQPQHCHAFRAI